MPFKRSHSFPFLKSRSVGMVLTPNCSARSLLFCTSTFANTIRSSNFSAIFLRIGVMTRHGAHQLAQKSKTIGFSVCNSSRMFPRVAWRISRATSRPRPKFSLRCYSLLGWGEFVFFPHIVGGCNRGGLCDYCQRDDQMYEDDDIYERNAHVQSNVRVEYYA